MPIETFATTLRLLLPYRERLILSAALESAKDALPSTEGETARNISRIVSILTMGRVLDEVPAGEPTPIE